MLVILQPGPTVWVAGEQAQVLKQGGATRQERGPEIDLPPHVSVRVPGLPGTARGVCFPKHTALTARAQVRERVDWQGAALGIS